MIYFVYVVVAILLLVLFRIINNSKTEHGAYLETKPINWFYIYFIWFIVGLLGWHRKRLLNNFWKVHFILFASILIANINNIYLYLDAGNPLIINQYTLFVGGVLVCLWAFDFFAIPYLRYLYISRYFRRDMNEFDILKGKSLEVEMFYKSLAGRADARKKKMDYLIKSAQQIKDEKNPSLIKWLGGGLSFEKERFEKIKNIAEEMNKLYDSFKTDSDQVSKYLYEARCVAQKNIYLCKELMHIIRPLLKTNKKKYAKDNLKVEQTLVKTDKYKPTIKYDSRRDISKLGNEIEIQMKTLVKNKTFYNLKNTDGKIDLAIAGLQVVSTAIDSALNYISNRNKQREELARMSLEIVQSLSKSTDDILINQAKILRASEILGALFYSNKAFVKAYVDVRDLCFGDISFKNFIRRPARDNSEELDRSIIHLQQVCSEYSKINQQTID